MENLKPGTVLCERDWNIWRNEYIWSFDGIKKITPTGKIRLESGELLSTLGRYEVYDYKMKKLYIQDNIQKNVIDMIKRLGDNANKIILKLPIDDIISLGNLLESLEIENIDSWSRERDKAWYDNSLVDFINFRNKFLMESNIDEER
ncbi:MULTISPECIES: hypothetical protein [Clostridia]|uniref:hypothetical protein n=1 Tax=Clostridia TaxID=186801 RepID=UPI002A8E8CD0|nr:hypothetical protein [Peptostreptococcus porci]MDY5098737.1 hypothetical protein [Clostridium sp.]MDY5437513.1 hypothetical protein [Peptostreptococcus porci]